MNLRVGCIVIYLFLNFFAKQYFPQNTTKYNIYALSLKYYLLLL